MLINSRVKVFAAITAIGVITMTLVRLDDTRPGWTVLERDQPISVQLFLRVFATVPSKVDGSPYRLISMARRGEDLYVVATEGKIFRLEEGIASLWFDVNPGLGDSFLTGGAEGGLRSLAFHPEYSENGKFYTSETHRRNVAAPGTRYVSHANNDFPMDSVVTEWTRNADGSVGPPREVLRIGSPGPHIIKQIIFDPHAKPGSNNYGLLYVAHGDGGIDVAPLGGHENNALGKILRIDPLVAADEPYSIPPTNPFLSDPDMLNEAYAIGLRIPHNLAFTRDGVLLAAEMGASNAEEVNIIQAGHDYGWKQREGVFEYLESVRGSGIGPLPDGDDSLQYTYPAVQIQHDPLYRGAIAIAGGYAVENHSALDGLYFFAEFASTGIVYCSRLDDIEAAVTQGPSELLSQAETRKVPIFFDHDSNPATPPLIKGSMLDVIPMAASYRGPEGRAPRADLRFGQGPRGEIYITSKHNNTIYLVENSVIDADS